MSERELPAGWVLASIDQVSHKGEQRKPDAAEQFIYVDIGSIDRESKVIASPQRLSGSDAPSRARKVISVGDVLVSLTRPNLNAVALVGKEYDGQIASTGFEVIKPVGVDSRFIFFLVRGQAFIDAISGRVQGALYPAAKGADVKRYQFPLPPPEEQKAIADKLDRLLAHVNHLKARLDAIPAILKRFRQSVLEAAVSGRLTEGVRGNSCYHNSSIGIEFPVDWELAEIGEVAEVKGGKRLPKGESLVSEDTGFPYIRAGQLKHGTVVSDAQLFLFPHVQKQISRYTVAKGDVYVTIVGACIGDAGVIPDEYDGANLTENAAKIFSFKCNLSSRFLSICLRSQCLQGIIQQEVKSGAQGKLALKRIKSLPIVIPPIEEQAEIIRCVDQFYAFADQVEKQVKNAQARVDKLTQSILAKAFRGELTAEWRAAHPELISGEHSAEALLERIKAEKAKQTPTRTRRGGRKATVTP